MASPLTPEEQRGLFGDPSSSPAAPQTSTAPAPSTGPLTPAQQQALFPPATSSTASKPPQAGGGWADAFQAGTYRGLSDIVNAPSAWFGWKPVIDTEGDLLTSGEKQAAQAHPYVAQGGRAFGQAVGTAPLMIAGGELIPAVGGAGVLPSIARGAVTGAGMGAAQNLLTAGENPQENLLTRAGRGALAGGVLGTVGGALEPAFGSTATISNATQDAGQRMAARGVNVTGPQLTTAAGAAPSAGQVGQVNRAFGNIFGKDTPDFSADTLNRIMPELGQDVGNTAAAGQINAAAKLPSSGQTVIDALNDIKTNYPQIPQVQKLVRDTVAKFDQNTGIMSGSDFQGLVRDSSKLDLASRGRSAEVSDAANAIEGVLHDGFAQSSSPGVSQAYSLAREKYKLAVAARTGADPQGNLVPGALYSAMQKVYGKDAVAQMGGGAGLSDQAVQFARDAQRLYGGPPAPAPSYFNLAESGTGAALGYATHFLPYASSNPLVSAGIAALPAVIRGAAGVGQRYQMTPGFGANLLARGGQAAGPYLAAPAGVLGNALMPQGRP